MSQRDIRERMLRFKLTRIAAKLEIDEAALLREAENIGMMRDAREAAGEVHIHLNNVTSVEHVERIVNDAVVSMMKRA